MVRQRWRGARHVQKANGLDGPTTQHLLLPGGGSRTMQRVHLGSSSKTLCIFRLLTFFKGCVPSLLPAEHPAQHTDCAVWSPPAAAALRPVAHPALRSGARGPDWPGQSRICPKAQGERSARAHVGTHAMKHRKHSSGLTGRFSDSDNQKKQISS